MKNCRRKLLGLGVIVLTSLLCHGAPEYTVEKGKDFSKITLPATADHPSIQYLIENQQSEIALNANNGFFDKGSVKAIGKMHAPEHEKKLISAHFDALVATKAGTMRWYFWARKAGTLKLSAQISELKEKQWAIEIAGQTKAIETSNSPLSFTIAKPGKYVCELSYLGNKPSASKVAGIKLGGDLAAEISVIRTRWRPSAVHSTFSSSSCPSTKLWVFETQNICQHSNYSPMTTAFGYYGATFTAEGKASGAMNFSMWVAGAKAKEAPSLAKTPHLLATGNPKASFGGFGHEGSGVKIRDWTPFAHKPKSVIQALRLEIKNGYNVYYGYFYDEPTQKWLLFAKGRKPVRKNNPITALRGSSFCEVPGPPQVERTGDQKRLIRRRGWFLDDNKNWNRVNSLTCSSKKTLYTNKTIGADKDGWLTMGTGGIENYPAKTTFTLKQLSTSIPAYLAKDKVAQLYKVPASIGETTATKTTETTASILYNIKDAGEAAQAILYYDTKDCISFLPRKFHGTERKGISAKLYTKDRTWQNSTASQGIKTGKQEFSLRDLKPKTKYFYRLFITNTTGQLWSEEAGSFTTE